MGPLVHIVREKATGKDRYIFSNPCFAESMCIQIEMIEGIDIDIIECSPDALSDEQKSMVDTSFYYVIP